MATFFFKGGDKLKQHLSDLAQNLQNKDAVDVGFPEGSTESNGANLPMVAAIQEFGAPSKGIPPRPFFRTMIAKNESHWGKDLAEQLKANDMDASIALSIMGEQMIGELQESIIDVTDPALSDVTLLLRERFGNNPQEITFKDVQKAREDIKAGINPNVSGSQAKPLVWTGKMLKSIVKVVR
jgi:hypothetical protein